MRCVYVASASSYILRPQSLVVICTDPNFVVKTTIFGMPCQIDRILNLNVGSHHIVGAAAFASCLTHSYIGLGDVLSVNVRVRPLR